jgi:hypothetical protein
MLKIKLFKVIIELFIENIDKRIDDGWRDKERSPKNGKVDEISQGRINLEDNSRKGLGIDEKSSSQAHGAYGKQYEGAYKDKSPMLPMVMVSVYYGIHHSEYYDQNGKIANG